MTDLTSATGLTKGAIYGNFINKEDLALKAFEHTIRKVIRPMYQYIGSENTGLDKLYAITRYHRSYYDTVKDSGGCPIIRVGMDARYNNPALFKAAKKSMQKFLKGIRQIIEQGKSEATIKSSTDSELMAKVIYTIIEGSLFTAFSHQDKTFIDTAMDHIDSVIIKNMIK